MINLIISIALSIFTGLMILFMIVYAICDNFINNINNINSKFYDIAYNFIELVEI